MLDEQAKAFLTVIPCLLRRFDLACRLLLRDQNPGYAEHQCRRHGSIRGVVLVFRLWRPVPVPHT